MMRRDFFEAVGRWNEPLGRTRSVDLEFHLRCVVRPPIGVVAAPVVGIRKHSGNFSADAYVNALGEIAILQYVRQHHAAAGRHELAIRQSLARRSAAAAAGAFAAGDFANAPVAYGGAYLSALLETATERIHCPCSGRDGHPAAILLQFQACAGQVKDRIRGGTRRLPGGHLPKYRKALQGPRSLDWVPYRELREIRDARGLCHYPHL